MSDARTVFLLHRPSSFPVPSAAFSQRFVSFETRSAHCLVSRSPNAQCPIRRVRPSAQEATQGEATDPQRYTAHQTSRTNTSHLHPTTPNQSITPKSITTSNILSHKTQPHPLLHSAMSLYLQTTLSLSAKARGCHLITSDIVKK